MSTNKSQGQKIKYVGIDLQLGRFSYSRQLRDFQRVLLQRRFHFTNLIIESVKLL